MKFKIISLGIISLPISITFCNDFPPITLPNGKVVQLPNKNEFKSLPSGAGGPVFFISNEQTLNTYESRKEVQTHITRPQPPVIQPTPPQPLVTQTQPAEVITISQNTKTNQNSLQSLTSWIKNLPNNLFTLKTGAFLAGSAALGYAVLWIKFLQHTSIAKKNNGWGSLQEHVPPQHLTSIPLLSLAEGLLDEIKKKHSSPNIADSIMLFLKEADNELEELNSFLTFHEWLDYFKVSFIFPDQKKLITRVKLKVQRLTLFKDAIAHWVNTHSARLIKNVEIPRNPLTFSFAFSQDETDVMELPNYAL